MQIHATASPRIRSNAHRPNGLVICSGYGIRVSVERGRLSILDGLNGERTERRFARATSNVKRLVMLGHSGFVTLEAMRWLRDVGAAFVHIDADGQLITVSAPQGSDHIHLRRAQAVALYNGAGLTVAKDLVRAKIAGQARVLGRFFDAADLQRTMERLMPNVDGADSADALRQIEAAAAATYWSAWAGVSVRFARKDERRVPDEWRTFASRTSPLTSSPRNAANPANAMLNYLYALLEAEARIAALTIGLDPGMGVYHADLRARDSLACDLMEAIRPEVDGWFLELMETRVFGVRDFVETHSGSVRLVPSLPQLLAEYAPAMRRSLAPVTEQIAKTLLRSFERGRDGRLLSGPRSEVATRLTQSRRTTAAMVAHGSTPRDRTTVAPKAHRGCAGCGVVLRRRDHQYCRECRPEFRDQQRAEYVQAGPRKLAQLRDEGKDPAHGGPAACRRKARNVDQAQAAAAWEREHGNAVDPDEFRRKILPGIVSLSVREIRRRTGLSLRYCSLIRSGEKVPHPRHWPTFLGEQGSETHKS